MKKFKKIYIEITNKCNRNCSFCSKDHKPKREMTLQEVEHVLKEIQGHTNYVYLHVKGEPFLHPNIVEILELCNKYQLKVNITTNGTLLKKYESILITMPCIRQLNISLHNFETGMTKYMDDIFHTVDRIIEKTDMIVVYRFWALPSNQLTQENLKIVDQIQLHHQLSKEMYEKILNEKNIKIGTTLYLNKAPLFDWPSLHNDYIGTDGFCHGLTRHIGILSDGTVIPCCLDSDGIISLGNIFEESLSNILENQKCKQIVKTFRDGKIMEPLCQHCSYRLKFSKCKKIELQDTGTK